MLPMPYLLVSPSYHQLLYITQTYHRQDLLCHREGIQLPAPPQCQKNIKYSLFPCKQPSEQGINNALHTVTSALSKTKGLSINQKGRYTKQIQRKTSLSIKSSLSLTHHSHRHHLFGHCCHYHHCHYNQSCIQDMQMKGNFSITPGFIAQRGRDKMPAGLQTFSYTFSCMKILVFWNKFHKKLFPGIQLIMSQPWFR